MRVCLNSIVKNEIDNLPRMLESVAPHITCFAILDTGSTDGTQDFIRKFFGDRDIPGVVAQGPFIDFSKARNLALATARSNNHGGYDYILFMDADMELVVEAPLPVLEDETYALIQKHGELEYFNTRLLRRDAVAEYVGVTHEYLSCKGGDDNKTRCWWFKDHACGSNRKFKYKRDVRLLTQDLKNNPNNERSWFYLGNTYRDMGRYQEAIGCYEKRIMLGGWDEEVWYAKLSLARCYRDDNSEATFMYYAAQAYQMRPSRAEPLYDLAKYHRLKGENNLAWMYAEAGAKVPYPTDKLFVESGCYNYGFLEEKSIAGFYSARTTQEGYDACDRLALAKHVPSQVRDQARNNLAHYLRPLHDEAPSFRMHPVSHNIDTQGGKYHVANPSITVFRGKLLANIRLVNYVIQPDGSYDMQGDSAIRTRNVLLPLRDDLSSIGKEVELRRPADLPPPAYEHVLGFEDVRLFSSRTTLCCSATVREQTPEGWCQQWMAGIDPVTGEMFGAGLMKTPAAYAPAHEKNWMPIVDNGVVMFMYRPGIVVNPMSDVVHNHQCGLDVGQFSGGSQLVFWEGGWVGVIHEARMDPAHGYSKRYYQHRFVWYDQDFALQKVSKPFCFGSRQIEFCAGLARHPRKNEFVLAFSMNDNSAWFGSISDSDLRTMIWH